MAKTTYVDILPEQEEAFFKNLQSGDRFVHSRLRKKITIFSRKAKKGITLRSLLPAISEIWANFSDGQKDAWSSAADEMNLSGWQLFVQDQSARIKNELPGFAEPSILHQSWVGHLGIFESADEIKLVQIHPHFYWISQKVKGKKGMYEPVLITEDFGFPFKISLNYKSDLEIVGGENFAKLYAKIWHSYQGQDLFSELEIPLDYSSEWKTAELNLTALAGYVVRYDLYFHLKGLRGDFYFDNVKAEHSAQNWVRDTFCKDISQGFTRAFYQIPKHWVAIILPEGSEFDSIYKDF